MKLQQIAVVLALAGCVLGYTLPTVHELQNTERMMRSNDQELSDMVGKYKELQVLVQ